jgi:hypothetical protein
VPPPPGAHPGYPGHPGYTGGHGRHRDWDRKRRRDRFRDGAAVVLGLGVLGALAAQPRYEDPYYAYPQEPGYDPYAYGPEDQPYGYGGGDGGYGAPQGSGVIRCSSNDYRTTWCQIPQGARAQLSRRLSSATCDYGRDWGVSPGAVWVANGCRAEFAIY